MRILRGDKMSTIIASCLIYVGILIGCHWITEAIKDLKK